MYGMYLLLFSHYSQVEREMDKFTYDDLVQKYNTQRAERFAYIDFVLRFMGGINRSDLLEFFGIGDAAASKEISEYKKLRPENVEYDRVLRKNVLLQTTFKPLLEIDAEVALGMLANGFNKNKLYDRPMLPYQRVGATPKHLDTDLISKVTRAIHSRTAIKCKYLSKSSDNYDERILLPTSFIYNGQTWLFRAFDRNNNNPKSRKFKFFAFSRVLNVEEMDSESALPSETIEQDSDWHLIVPLQLTLHPSLKEKEKLTLIQDFGLNDESHEFTYTEKAVLVYFLVKNWKIDLGNSPLAKGEPHNFSLKNADSLKHLECMENLFKEPA